ncbi:hypothetical protein H310_13456 [Aphanomyces invadans]|uniref:Uncharacterized protein n=1 Tax=Aphanomyces invadans TaxID=157072 RepID=A0A024TDU2_9STRA|nr:hypothetical protein H310_13456 [Aphanomyces invadans]ETV92223.1 hypothetical protein H310_13456 [Aphanomyces invadans]|eukprot:XP_008879187.1 hypothetical protein H310_13456 [Aphanomyces invadans]
MRAKLTQGRAAPQYGSVSPLLEDEVHSRRMTKAKVLLVAGAVSIVAAGFVSTLHASPTAVVNSSSIGTPHSKVQTTPVVVHVVETAFENGNPALFRKLPPLKLKRSATTKKAATAPARPSTIHIDDSKVFQEILGFGGAFTEASALNFKKLPRVKQEEVLRLYFDEKTGAAYSFGRVPMNSCDFSVASYSFDDVVGDVSLEHFDTNVTHDAEAIIPFLRRALKLRPDIKLFLSPWSPPAWMKAPNSKGEFSMTGSATPLGINPTYQAAWALYFSKFISAYKGHGINFWGLTPQNEPMFPAPWEACFYEAKSEATFVGDFLGPQIRKDHPDVKILVFDHNRDAVTQWAAAAYEKASAYVDGVAFHWYNGDGRELDGALYYNHLNDTHHLNPSKLLLATEACNCPGVATGKDAWFRAQRYGHDIISDINNHANGWVDWNLLLDHEGGPNHLNNTCDAPVLLTPDAKGFVVQPLYYFIKHFSAFVPPGSKRIAADVRVSFGTPGTDHALFLKYPSATHVCDGSVRQAVVRTQDNKLQVKGTDFCIDVVKEWFGDKVELTMCIYTQNVYKFTEAGEVKFHNKCLSVAHGSTENGAAITLDECVGSTSQKWTVGNGVVTNQATNFCITAGYAFAQAAAFKTPSNRTVVVVQNEHSQLDASFELTTPQGSVDTIVPKGAIRTFYWDP